MTAIIATFIRAKGSPSSFHDFFTDPILDKDDDDDKQGLHSKRTTTCLFALAEC